MFEIASRKAGIPFKHLNLSADNFRPPARSWDCSNNVQRWSTRPLSGILKSRHHTVNRHRQMLIQGAQNERNSARTGISLTPAAACPGALDIQIKPRLRAAASSQIPASANAIRPPRTR